MYMIKVWSSDIANVVDHARWCYDTNVVDVRGTFTDSTLVAVLLILLYLLSLQLQSYCT